jgi:hypothetical protein
MSQGISELLRIPRAPRAPQRRYRVGHWVPAPEHGEGYIRFTYGRFDSEAMAVGWAAQVSTPERPVQAERWTPEGWRTIR